MSERVQERWSRFWFTPERPTNLSAARVMLALVALWVVLSRNDLPSIVGWPSEIWQPIMPERRLRFFMIFPLVVERVLWWLLHLSLVTTIFGVATRWSALVSGLLLYHFGPFEGIVWTGNPYLRGYTIPALGLLIIAASRTGGSRGGGDIPEPSWHHRWPLVLIQLLFAQIYFFAAWSKLYASGMHWMSAENMNNYILALDQTLGFEHSALNTLLVDHPSLGLGMSICGMLLDALFPLALFSRRARWVILPVTAFFHIASGIIFHIWFQNAWLLLLYVDWSALERRR